jgi:hypothetical protein
LPDSAEPNEIRVLNKGELDATFQLLVERAQYITGATGTALALPLGEDMVCRASAGSCAPKVGACLQVRSGLTGESIARRQLLRCDNADTDPRVNLEACRALGIASIVVMPLLRPNGEVRGLFELFADHPYAFEERDLIALERMAALTNTALDLAERHEPIPPGLAEKDGDETRVNEQASALPGIATSAASKTSPAIEIGSTSEVKQEVTLEEVATAESSNPVSAAAGPGGPAVGTVAQQSGLAVAAAMAPVVVPLAATPEEKPSVETPAAALSPEALPVEKCAGCGFPVSEGRSLCLDCERKREVEKEKFGASEPSAGRSGGEAPGAGNEMVPAFLANASSAKRSWLADHVNLLAIAVLIVGVVVCIVVFR